MGTVLVAKVKPMARLVLVRWLPAALAGLMLMVSDRCLAATGQLPAGGAVHGGLAVQQARNAFLAAQRTKRYYTPGRFDLHDLPAYVPEQRVSGTVRVWAADMWGNSGFQQRLAADFHRLQPGARLQFVSIPTRFTTTCGFTPAAGPTASSPRRRVNSCASS